MCVKISHFRFWSCSWPSLPKVLSKTLRHPHFSSKNLPSPLTFHVIMIVLVVAVGYILCHHVTMSPACHHVDCLSSCQLHVTMSRPCFQDSLGGGCGLHPLPQHLPSPGHEGSWKTLQTALHQTLVTGFTKYRVALFSNLRIQLSPDALASAHYTHLLHTAHCTQYTAQCTLHN